MELTHATIQKWIDQAPSGGTVTIPAGVYHLRNAVKLRSNVHLRGEDGAILRKVPSVASRLSRKHGYGHYEIVVDDPDLFEVGDGIHLRDARSGGFYTTVATITERDGDTLFIDRMFNHDYGGRDESHVERLHPLIEGCGVENVTVSNLELDGNVDETRDLNGCRGGGVFLIRCRNITLDNLNVHHYKTDGISFQQCVDTTVRSCRITHCKNAGLHPGSGSVRYVMENNVATDNGKWGLFYCLRTTHSICRGNTFERNGECGISVGELDTDHLITNNTVRDNRGPGVLWRDPVNVSGDRCHLHGNTISGNDGPAVLIPAGIDAIDLRGNNVEGDIQIDPGATNITRDGDAEPTFKVGPAALPLNGARHLGIARLPVWIESP